MVGVTSPPLPPPLLRLRLPEFLLPGVSDAATIVFTVMHQAPARAVCLGQALVQPKRFRRAGEHELTVTLTKQHVSAFGTEGRRVVDSMVDNQIIIFDHSKVGC